MSSFRECLDALWPPHVQSVLEGDPIAGEFSPDRTSSVTYYALDSPEAPARFDALFLDSQAADGTALRDRLRPLRLKLNREGAVFCRDAYVDGSFDTTLETFSDAGLGFYEGWHIDETTGAVCPLEGTPVSTGGWYVYRFQRFTYDPMRHACQYLEQQDVRRALDILHGVPGRWLTNDAVRGLHARETLVALMLQNRNSGGAQGFAHLNAARHHYNRACTWLPKDTTVYRCMANLWQDFGRPDLSRRLLETVATILPTPPIQEALASHSQETPIFETPTWPTYRPDFPLRILFVCHPESDFGSDVLHDGFRRVLGADRVVEYPWKPVLHGEDEAAATGYPCTFDWPESPVSLSDVVAQLAAGAFEAIVYSDTLGSLPPSDVKAIRNAAGDTPLFVLDMWDECGDMLGLIQQRDGLKEVAGYFKREMVQGGDYPANTWPLLFSFPENRIPPQLSWEGRTGIFWTGKLMGGARRLQMSWLEKMLPLQAAYGTPLSPAEYAEKLQSHLMGISLAGNGFDTVRYWELPAHGTLLLSERIPLAIPFDYEDGKHAVFFDTVQEACEKGAYYLAHPDEALEIAQAGHAHLLAHHTGSARARQCLARIQQRIEALRK